MKKREWMPLPAAAFVIALALLAPAAPAQDSPPQADPTPAAGAATPVSEANAAEEASPAWPPGLLMDALGTSGVRKALDDLSLRFYGYVESGFTGRLTGGQDPLPFRNFEARRPNNLRLHQLSLTGERAYDPAKPFDLGGKVQGLFGGDAMLTHARGLFDRAGEGEGEAWADLFQAYATAWFKTGEESGLEVLVGKFGTPMGFEATEAGLAPMYSHSFLFGATPYTHTGVKLTYTFSPAWSAYFALVEGWDVFEDNNDAHSYMAGGTWQGADELGDNPVHTAAFCIMTGPEQDDSVHNYRTSLDAYYTRWWTQRLSQTFNANFGTEEGATEDGRRDRWYGLAHYLSYVFDDAVTGTWRAEWFRDERGSWTGFSGSLFENTLGLSLTPWPQDKILRNLTFRPEFRWDFACDPVFGGDRRNQLTAAIDLIFKF